MADPGRRSSTGFDRRASLRSARQMTLIDDGDDDEFAMAAMGMSDGYRPGDGFVPSEIVESRVNAHDLPATGRRTPPARPSSISKPKLDSFALRNEGTGPQGPMQARSLVGAFPSYTGPTRSSSVSTNSTFTTTESPYQGPSGPTHPYQMYPQESRLMRTASIATTSTMPSQVERNYTGPSGPTHPYGMYPQGISMDDVGSNVLLPQAPLVPVGFPGSNDQYQRRLGPEGEEAGGMIGPDGHAEELPPYTQYPDEAIARKTQPITVSTLPVPVVAGGMGMATRNPEFDSVEELSTLQSRQSLRSFATDSSVHRMNMAAMDEKPVLVLKPWQAFLRKKAGNVVPYWVLFMFLGVIVLFGIVLGAVFTALKPKHPIHHPSGDGSPTPQSDGQPTASPTPTMTTTFDASPYKTVPANLPSLPTGTYDLPINIPSTIQNGCLLDSSQSAAWTCTIPQQPQLNMDVINLPGASPLYDNEASFVYANGTPSFFPYGTMPPLVQQAQVMTLVNDTSNPGRGPAWWFQVPYNKVVIVQEDLISSASSIAKRISTSQFINRKSVAQPGDKPWFCYWNGTLLEAFVYVNSTSVAGTKTTTASPSASSSTSWPSSFPQGGGPPWPSFVPSYPKVVKIEERRVPEGPNIIPPYCVQHLIAADGSASPYMNSSHQAITVYLNETESTGSNAVHLHRRDEDKAPLSMLSEREAAVNCGCVWLYT